MKFKSAALIVTGSMLLSLLVACGNDKNPVVPPVLSTATYLPVGPQTAVPATTVTSGGWTVCHSELYNANTAVLTTVLATCNGARLMLACRPVAAANYQLLAQAPRADVTFVTPNDNTTVHNANGSGWYYSTDHSWGFIRQGDAINKEQCDTNSTAANDQRLCWHTVQVPNNLSPGFRCGVDAGLNESTAFERHILHAD